MSTLSSSLVSFLSLKRTNSSSMETAMDPSPPQLMESLPPRGNTTKLTKEQFVNSFNSVDSGLKLQRKSSASYDDFYEMASLQMFY